MTSSDAIELKLEISAEDTAEADIDRMTRNLLAELRETDVESAKLVTSDSAPSGTKSTDPVTTGAIVLAVLPTFLPKIVEFVQAWALRGHGRTVKFKGKISGQTVEFEGHPEDLQKILETLSKGKQKK
jgi:hypothetical protein